MLVVGSKFPRPALLLLDRQAVSARQLAAETPHVRIATRHLANVARLRSSVAPSHEVDRLEQLVASLVSELESLVVEDRDLLLAGVDQGLAVGLVLDHLESALASLSQHVPVAGQQRLALALDVAVLQRTEDPGLDPLAFQLSVDLDDHLAVTLRVEEQLNHLFHFCGLLGRGRELRDKDLNRHMRHLS